MALPSASSWLAAVSYRSVYHLLALGLAPGPAWEVCRHLQVLEQPLPLLGRARRKVPGPAAPQLEREAASPTGAAPGADDRSPPGSRAGSLCSEARPKSRRALLRIGSGLTPLLPPPTPR